MVSKQTWLFITSEDVSRGIPQGLLDVGDEVLVCLIERISGNYDSVSSPRSLLTNRSQRRPQED